MEDLTVLKLYKENNYNQENFKNSLRSVAQVNTKYDQVIVNYEWLDLMEDTIRYLDNILRNPNRFIVNEEEIEKIELARRVTVESIRHLAKHTNYIQKIEDNGDVKPSKILNINKDESYDTYENRLIYTLIDNMRNFVDLKKKETLTQSSTKDVKKIDYKAKTKVGKENIDISVSLSSSLIDMQKSGQDGDKTVEERIEKLEQDISMLQNTEVYKDLKKKHVARVIPPIKKTNVILKNTNFQYAMKLWDFLQEHVANDTKHEKENQNYEATGVLKEYYNDLFYLNYLAMDTLSKNKNRPTDRKQIEEITNNLIERIVELNLDLPESELKEKIGEKIAITKYKKQASLSEIQSIFSNSIKKYLEKIENFNFRGGEE